MTPQASAEDPGARSQVAANLALLFSTVIWAANLPASEILLLDWDPYTLAFARVAMAVSVLLTILLIREGRAAFGPNMPWGRVFLLGSVGIGGGTVLMMVGIAASSAVSAGIIVTSGPVIGALIARLIYGMPLKRGLPLAIALAVAGGVIVVLLGGNAAADGRESRGGEVFVFAGMVCWLWYSASVQHHLRGRSHLAVAALTSVPGLIVLAALAGGATAAGLVEPQTKFDTRSLLLLAYVGLGPAGLSILLWHFGVSRVGVAVAAMYNNLVPIVVVLVAMTYGSYPTWAHLAGGVLIVTAVVYAQRRGRQT